MFQQILTSSLLTFVICTTASAGITTYADRSVFNSQGTIAFNSNFDDFTSAFTHVGDPYTRGDVRYTSGDNLAVGSSAQYSIGKTRTVMSYNYWSPLTGDILGAYNLFGFDAAVTSGPITVTLTTNQDVYVFAGLTVGAGNPDFTFLGYQATGAGEYFTNFRIESRGTNYLPGMTDVAVGTAGLSSVPEPSSMLLLTSGAACFAAWRRRRS